MMTELTPTEIRDQQLYLQWGLSEVEYNQIQTTLGRLPNFTETGLFAAMWSEHCSYKNSKPLLKQFPTQGARILQGPGEGAGIVDIGDGQAVVFKAESHNHPTAVEPYQGAATGVGGIIRDIFSMGARPIALLDSLHFGELNDAHTKYLVDQTIAGIGDYGNCMGIPTVGGETTFDPIYQNNPVMNAMCVGLLDIDDQQKGAAAGIGNAIYYVGTKTGRDGIQGAIFASTEFSDEHETQRSAVQVGDPFAEKKLMEACLELIHDHADLLVGIQDMGAAGLVSSSAEMGAKAGFGMELNLDLVPQREADMIPYEMMLSESQERMLLCIKQGREAEVEALFEKYEVEAVKIGVVTDSDRYQLYFKSEIVADVPIHALVDEAPVYQQPSQRPAHLQATGAQYQPQIEDLTAVFEQLLQQPTIADKHAIFERYDAQVQTNTITTTQSDVAVVRVRGTQKALAMTTDANPRYLYLDPEIGGQIAVSEAARNIVASGATPLAITDCLNFGSPEDPESYYELAQATKGMATACERYETPVISGNVSLYNESNRQPIYPTPLVGMVGLIENPAWITTLGFKAPGDLIYVIGQTQNDFNGSELQKMQTGKIDGPLFDFDLTTEQQNQALITKLIHQQLLQSAHDLAEGGLAIALAESCFAGDLGIQVTFNGIGAELFSETQSRFIVSIKPENQAMFEAIAGDAATYLGRVTGNQIEIKAQNDMIKIGLNQAKATWKGALEWQLK
jgi:phosphoribosylformylglycinamidine synthase II